MQIMSGIAEHVVLWLAVEPATPADAERLDVGLQRLIAEDPRLQARPRGAGQTILAGISEPHLEGALDRLRREFRVAATLGGLQVAYKEALTRTASGEGRFVSESRGRRQFAHVRVRISPLPAGSGCHFGNEVFGTVIPDQFLTPTVQGIESALQRGVIAGCPIDDVRVELVGGSHHAVESSVAAFKIAGAMALEDAAKKAQLVLTEPVMRLELRVQEGHVTAVTRDLERRQAQVEVRGLDGRLSIVHARAPMRVLFGYQGQLRQLTGGASVEMVFDRYEPVAGSGPPSST
jgi:elongation factor G